MTKEPIDIVIYNRKEKEIVDVLKCISDKYGTELDHWITENLFYLWCKRRKVSADDYSWSYAD